MIIAGAIISLPPLIIIGVPIFAIGTLILLIV
jgi:hypothetical protein